MSYKINNFENDCSINVITKKNADNIDLSKSAEEPTFDTVIFLKMVYFIFFIHVKI